MLLYGKYFQNRQASFGHSECKWVKNPLNVPFGPEPPKEPSKDTRNSALGLLVDIVLNCAIQVMVDLE